MRRRAVPFALLLSVAVLAGCGSGAAEERPVGLRFTDVTDRTGIRFEHAFGDDSMDSIVESAGVGVTLLDYDGDSRLDIYFANGAHEPGVNRGPAPKEPHRNRLYRNLGGLRFADVTEQAGVGDPGYGMGACAADYDNDGDTDLYVANFGRNVLYRNEGDGTFRDVTEAAGVGDTHWSVPAFFVDFDGDGWLDLYSSGYLVYDATIRPSDPSFPFPSPLAYEGQPDRLYRNLGDGRFEEVTKTSGIDDASCHSMGAGVIDFDGDGKLDLFVSGDGMANRFFRNLGGLKFSEIADRAGVALGSDGSERGSMGVEVLDLDGDGRLDLLVPDFGPGSAYVADRPGFFVDRSMRLGIGAACLKSVTWSGVALDADHDGFLDLFFSNSSAFRLEGDKDRILRGGPAGRFEDVSGSAGPYFERRFVSRGVAVGDLDGDGDRDIVVAVLGGHPRVLRNDSAPSNHWIAVRLRGTRSNRDGIGARVELSAGERTQVRLRKPSAGYLSQNGPLVHFGLGGHTRARLRVTWPGGRTQELDVERVDRIVEVVEPDGR